MKLAFIIITVLICLPGIAQVEVTKNLERNSSEQVALCKTKLTGDAEIRNIWGDLITVLPKGTKVSVYTTENAYWLIKTSEIEGYTNERFLKVTNKMERVKNGVNTQENTRAEANNQEEILQEETKLWRGMSKAMVRINLGEPNAVNKFYSYRSGQTEAWYYDNKTLYFENGILMSLYGSWPEKRVF